MLPAGTLLQQVGGLLLLGVQALSVLLKSVASNKLMLTSTNIKNSSNSFFICIKAV